MKHSVAAPIDEHGQNMYTEDSRGQGHYRKRRGSISSSSSDESMGKEEERIRRDQKTQHNRAS